MFLGSNKNEIWEINTSALNPDLSYSPMIMVQSGFDGPAGMWIEAIEIVYGNDTSPIDTSLATESIDYTCSSGAPTNASAQNYGASTNTVLNLYSVLVVVGALVLVGGFLASGQITMSAIIALVVGIIYIVGLLIPLLQELL
jgi:hypothetical protein